MKKKIITIFMLVLIFLSGCWDVKEPERMFYIYGLGVDYKDGKYDIYAQIVDFTNIAKSEQPNIDAVQATVGHASGKTMDEALFELYHSMDQMLFWGDLTYLVLTEEVLKNGHANEIINTFVRYRETRYKTWVYGTKDSVKEIMLITPILNRSMSLSKISDPMNSYEQESLVEPINFRKMIIRLNEPSYEVSIPLVSIIENWETEKRTEKATSINGVAVISPNELKGFFTGKKVRGLQWMTKETKRGEITVKLDSNKDSYLTVALDKIKLKVTSDAGNDKVKFDIDIKMDVTVSGFQENLTESEIRTAVEKEVTKEIEETYMEALKKDIDIYRLSEYLYRYNIKKWKEVQKDGKVDLDKDSIRTIKINISKVNSGRKSFKKTISD
ncbi:Ger(x)C family spore germination protein [Psychrobacillus glaciei]|uniref:Ger(X)C family spore germination protein n=1 Tax=Psychrobacillus glaciei TaxID=2283160 RepID=A0A5J6STI3_9BACI|nr:Ger(x)C family spore germination protein [Psychrobacillus glaciei]QFG00763.1 Ger(x)C family spore germination protein [Psychrobacillus glaciei]